MDEFKIDLNKLSQLDDDLEVIYAVFKWLRPNDVTEANVVEEKIHLLAQAMDANPEQATTIRQKVHTFIVNLRFLPLYSEVGILPRRNFTGEFWQRVYDKLMPRPPVTFSARNLLDQAFDQPDDPVWVQNVSDDAWLHLYHIFAPDEPGNRIKRHLQIEALYALEMLSIWLAAEEMEDELLRLDPSIADHDSNFIAQEREISQFVAAYRSQWNPAVEERSADAAHAWVMLQQCEEQIKGFSQLALNKGSHLDLTYLLERLEQTLARIYMLLNIFVPNDKIVDNKTVDNKIIESETVDNDTVDNDTVEHKCIAIFRELVSEQNNERSIIYFIRQTNHLLAKSITNHVSKTGEHYVTKGRGEYIEMLWHGLGAGVFIAVMALIKIRIVATDLSMGWATLWISLNYGLGFVIIHICHFTVATKQPAMTAAYITEKLEHTINGSVDRKELAKLIIDVGRSQFAAILGNVVAALSTAMIIGVVLGAFTDGDILKPEKAAELMQKQNPYASLALFYAAIAGVWLFVSGLVAGYFDNQSLYSDLPGRIRHQPLLIRILPSNMRHGLADYISGHYGALWGNFFFGVLLGVTAYVGYLLNLPLDIRHVAFSVANVGYSSIVTWPGLWIFLEFVIFALLIGVVNLTVSFVFAVNVATRSRGIRLGNIGAIVRAYWREVRSRPWELILPPITEAKPDQQQVQS